jgi:DNA-binding NtrC family response regulator
MVVERTMKRDPTASSDGDEPEKPQLFVILECQRPRGGGARYALDGVDEIVVGRGATRSATREKDGGRTRLVLRFPDPLMSSTHAKLTKTAPGGWEVADLGSTNGTYVNGLKVPRADVDDGELFELGSTLFVLRAEMPTPSDATPVVESHALGGRVHGFGTMVPSYSRRMRALLQMAMTEMPILLLGESGTGKEVLASGIHAVSGRRGELVPVNCGGIPESLVEGQLFGHTKGAFSGALRDEPGFVRASDKGTLFLDEIGDLPRTSQAALLRVLQEREVTPVGSTKATKVDLRVVSATHRPVDALGAEGGFRSDLYARVAGYTHHLLPLRERKEDLGMLVADLLERLAPERDVRMTPALGRALFHYDWPLNVRELMHCLKAAVVFAEEGALDLKHVPEAIRTSSAARPSVSTEVAAARPLSEDEDRLKTRLALALTQTRGNVSEVARSMGKTRMQIHRWMRRFGLDPETHRK